jgi:Leucine-rich repeat (LRR) protein
LDKGAAIFSSGFSPNKCVDMDDRFKYDLYSFFQIIRRGNYDIADYCVKEMLRLKKESMIHSLLKGCHIDQRGCLHVGKHLVEKDLKQHKIDYAIWKLILHVEQTDELDPSLLRKNITRICFRYYYTPTADEDTSSRSPIFICPDGISKLSNLRSLHMSGLGLDEFPDEILEISSLRELDISSNPIQKIPAEIKRLTDLRLLKIDRCEIADLPDELAELKKLKVLKAGSNRLTKIPDGIRKNHSIKWLDISENPLRRIYVPKNGLKSLKILIAGGIRNKISSELVFLPRSINKLKLTFIASEIVPLCIREMVDLESLELRHTNIIKLPHWLPELKKLGHLNISDNKALIHIPGDIAKMPCLKTVIYTGLPKVFPQFPPSLNDLDMEGFRVWMADHTLVHDAVDAQTGETPTGNVYALIHYWKNLMYDPGELKLCLKKGRKELFGADTMFVDLLNADTNYEMMMDAVSIIRVMNLQLHLKALLAAIRLKNGFLYFMDGVPNVFGVGESVIRFCAVRIIAQLTADELFEIFGERSITATNLFISNDISLPRTFQLFAETGVTESQECIATIEDVDQNTYTTTLKDSLISNLSENCDLGKIRKLSLTNFQAADGLIHISEWTNLTELAIDIDQCEQIVIRNCPSLKHVRIWGNKQGNLIIQHCPQLKSFSVDRIANINLSEIFNECRFLQFVRIGEADMKTLPDELGKLQELLRLVIFNMPIRRLPRTIWQLKKLVELNISHWEILSGDVAIKEFLYGDMDRIPLNLYKLTSLEVCRIPTNNSLLRRALARPGDIHIWRLHEG